jgi:hypothetical protein
MYNCKLCGVPSQPRAKRLTHRQTRPDGSISGEVPCCPRCYQLLGDQVPVPVIQRIRESEMDLGQPPNKAEATFTLPVVSVAMLDVAKALTLHSPPRQRKPKPVQPPSKPTRGRRLPIHRGEAHHTEE